MSEELANITSTDDGSSAGMVAGIVVGGIAAGAITAVVLGYGKLKKAAGVRMEARRQKKAQVAADTNQEK